MSEREHNPKPMLSSDPNRMSIIGGQIAITIGTSTFEYTGAKNTATTKYETTKAVAGVSMSRARGAIIRVISGRSWAEGSPRRRGRERDRSIIIRTRGMVKRRSDEAVRFLRK